MHGRLRWAIAAGCALWLGACGGAGHPSEGAPAEAGGASRPGGAADPGKSLNLMTWAGVVAPHTVADFEKRTGIKVHISYAVSNEDLETRILAGDSGFDIVPPSADYFERQIKAGGYLALDKSRLRNLAGMDPELMAKVAAQDPGNAHGIIYIWGTNGVGYNEKMIRKLVPDAPLDSWRSSSIPPSPPRSHPAASGMVDSPVDVMRAVLSYLGRDPNSQKAEDLADAETALIKIRPYNPQHQFYGYIEALANGDLCVALGYSGDMLQAQDRARDANTGAEIQYMIPKEGSIMWFDMLAIPSHAPNVDSAYAFMDYVMQPQVIADMSNFTHFPNANAAALPLILPAVREDPAIYPSPGTRRRLTVVLPDTPEQLRAITRMWQRFKAGGLMPGWMECEFRTASSGGPPTLTPGVCAGSRPAFAAVRSSRVHAGVLSIVAMAACVAFPAASCPPRTPRTPRHPDHQRLKRTAVIHLGKTADWVAVTPDAVWVGSTGPFAVHRIDPHTNTRVATVALRASPARVSPRASAAYGFPYAARTPGSRRWPLIPTN